ncbi:MAG: phage major capsid protein, P2 family [Moraxellaceae bacterium]|nr:phage major capsid protein, P2 family [Moraxellaceae bacterium]
MRNETRLAYEKYTGKLAALNGVGSIATKFTVTPSVQQKLENLMQESSDFLKQINIVGVTEKTGQKIGLGIGSPIAGTTNTSVQPRVPRDLTDVSLVDEYDCTKTDYDTFITYAKLDIWAKFPDFQVRIRDLIAQRQALDRILIGFNGTSRAATSNRTTNPLLQDVNIGWIEKVRINSPQRLLSEGANTGEIRIGATGDYKNLDALVYALVNDFIDPWHQEDTKLVVICGRSLLADKYFPLVNTNHAPTEEIAADTLISQKRLGGLQAVRVPNFPADKIMVTRLDNLSIYFQEGARRRHVVEKPDLDRIENYESSNDAYIVEEYGMVAVAENIVLV